MTVTADHVKKNIADLQTSQMGRTHGASVWNFSRVELCHGQLIIQMYWCQSYLYVGT